MVKPVLLVALVANVFVVVTSTGEAWSKSSSYSSATGHYYPQQQGPSSSVATRSVAASSYYGGSHASSYGRPRHKPFCRKNEIWAKCPIAVCVPKTCDDVGFPIACPDLRPDGRCPVPPGCICKENFVRNCENYCIPMTRCPSCGGDPNAVSGYGNNCNRLCSNYNKTPGPCPDSRIYNSCVCRPGFVFDEIQRRCVLPCECTRMICKKNEVYDPCPAPCPFRTCGIDDSAISCVPPLCPGDPDCPPPTCRCRNGFYRNDVGDCVTLDECPVCSGLNEIYDPCPAPCPPQRCGVNIALILCAVPPKLGDPECQPGCRCIDNYVRNYTGVCIPRDQCPICPKNEEYDLCIAPCPPRRCDVDERLIKCAAPPKLGDPDCVAGCRCSDGFYRNDDDLCVTRDECPPVCNKENEEYSDCINGGCQAKNCSQIGLQIPCVKLDPDSCIKGCLCKEGYLREDNGECVLEKDCKPRCNKENEEYSDCINGGCQAKNCSQIGLLIPCVKLDPDSCIKGCLCKEGYLREDNGECVLEKDCKQPQCKENEKLETCPAGPCLPTKCSELGYPLPCQDAPADSECPTTPTCVCIDGYVKNDTDICIPKTDCPSCGGDPNAQSGAGTNCGKRCEDVGKKPGPCILIFKLNGCDCKDGYYFDKKQQKCVLPSECTLTCGDDEVYDPCSNGGCTLKNCSQISGPMPCKKPKKCIPGCSCKEGFLRSEEGVCIPAENCTEAKCGKHEQFNLCPDGLCEPLRCDQLGFSVKCPLMKDGCCPGPPGCICEYGYVRNANGTCIPKRKCPSCGGDSNAWSGCGVNCGKKCEDLTKKNRICPKICLVNACDCKDGFYYDKNLDKCVTADCCTPQCGANEVYDKCINGGCGPRNCSESDDPIICKNVKECKGGCKCIEGYLRLDKTGECVPKKECPKICTKPNEIYVKCPPTCPPQTCESINKTYHCPLIKTNQSDCVGECRCIEGYFRNPLGECISKTDCLKCPGPFEYFSCGPACDNVCKDLATQSKDNCLIKNIKCVPRCYCKDGYARDNDCVCVPIEDCPVTNTTDPVVNITLALENLERGNVKLTIALQNEMLVLRPGENIMFSALSLVMPIAELGLGACKDTLAQILNLLNLQYKEEIYVAFPVLIEGLKDLKDLVFELRNKIYANIKICPLKEQFNKDVKEIFSSQTENIDFNASIEAAKTINAWCSNSTRGLINEIVKPEMLNSQTRLALFNVLYFLGNWLRPFDPKKTKPADFYLNDKDVVSRPTMNQINTFKYGESDDLDAQLILLPYNNEDFALFIILSRTKTGMNTLLPKLNPDTFAKILKSLDSERCNVSVPLMDFSNEFSDLKELLMKLGLTSPFGDSACFDGIIENNEPLVITDLVQKSVLQINELGTKAVTVTGAIVSTTAVFQPPETKQVICDHPFLFYVLYKTNPIFSGYYVGAD